MTLLVKLPFDFQDGQQCRPWWPAGKFKKS
jgi:hypothetical protein